MNEGVLGSSGNGTMGMLIRSGLGLMAWLSGRMTPLPIIAAATSFANGGAGDGNLTVRSTGLSGSSSNGDRAQSFVKSVSSNVNSSSANETESKPQVSYQSQMSSAAMSSLLRRGIGALARLSWNGSSVAILPLRGTTAGVGSLMGPWM